MITYPKSFGRRQLEARSVKTCINLTEITLKDAAFYLI